MVSGAAIDGQNKSSYKRLRVMGVLALKEEKTSERASEDFVYSLNLATLNFLPIIYFGKFYPIYFDKSVVYDFMVTYIRRSTLTVGGEGLKIGM